MEIAESVAEGRRDEALLAQVAGEHHRRRARLAPPARLAEHLQGGNAAWSMAPWRLRWKLFTASAKDTPACIRHSSSKRVVKSAITSPIRGSSACRSNNGTLRRNSALSLQRARTSAKVQPNTLDKVTPCCAARRSRRRLSPAESWNARRRVRGWRMLSGAQANGRAGASGKRGRRSSQ